MADALERNLTATMLATGQRNTSVAVIAVETELAATLVRTFAITIHRVAALLADGDIAQIAGPTWEALYVAVVIAHVVRVLILRVGNFAGLKRDDM